MIPVCYQAEAPALGVPCSIICLMDNESQTAGVPTERHMSRDDSKYSRPPLIIHMEEITCQAICVTYALLSWHIYYTQVFWEYHMRKK